MKMQKQMQGLENNMNKLITQVGELSNRIDEANNKDEVRQMRDELNDMRLLMNGWKYLGRGTWKTRDDSFSTSGLTFPECVKMCDYYRSKGRWSDYILIANTPSKVEREKWNGLSWRPRDRLCECSKNDRGHRTAGMTDWMHF